MKRLFSFLISLWFGLFCKGQTIEWAKSYDFGSPGARDEYVDQIIQTEDSSYLAIARIGSMGYSAPGQGRQYGLALVHLSKTGDTLFVKNMKVTMSESNSLCKTWDQKLLIAFTMNVDTALGSKMRVYKTDYAGNTIWMYPFIGQSWQDAFIRKVIPTRDDGAFVVGEANSIFPGSWRDGFLAKINFFGQLEWSLRYTDASYTSINNMEEMPDGNYLLSGSAGQRIWSCVVDSTGFQLSDKTWFKSHETGGMINTGVKQGHGAQSYYAFGEHTSRRTAVVKYDQNGDSVWVKRNTWVGRPPNISLDGGYARAEGYIQGNYYFSKYASDSSNLWRILLTDFQSTPIGIACIAYDGLGSAVLAGYKNNGTPNRDDMYLIKVSNVGYPVDPLSAKGKVVTQNPKGPELVAYPNPCQQFFYLQGIKGKTKVALYNLQGALLQSYTIGPTEAIPAWKLSPGIYVWKAEVGGKVFTGKMIKE